MKKLNWVSENKEVVSTGVLIVGMIILVVFNSINYGMNCGFAFEF